MNDKHTLPSDIRPFNFDTDDHLTLAFTASMKDAADSLNKEVVSKENQFPPKSTNLERNIIEVRSLVDGKKATYLHLSVSLLGFIKHDVAHYEIAGVDTSDRLWFEEGGRFFLAEHEVIRKKKHHNELMQRMKEAGGGDMLDILKRLIGGMKDNPPSPGDEWKNG